MTADRQRRALFLALTVILSVLTVGSPAAAAPASASVELADDTEGAKTVHNWSATTGTSGTLTDVRLNYSGTGTNVSAVSSVSVTLNGTTATVHGLASVEGDEVLEINVSNTSLTAGDPVLVNATRTVNPGAVGTHSATIELDNGGSSLDSATASFSIDGRNTVEGTVTNASDGSAIAGATVSASNDGGFYSNTTDANGNYTIDVPDGTYTVSVDPDGYVANQTSGVPLSGGVTASVDLALDPAGTINGTVKNGSGSAIAGATVTATDANNDAYAATADGNGEYEIEVPGGTYTVKADNESYATTSVDGVGVVVGGNTTQNVTLNDAAVLSGTVTDGAGTPVSGATVETYDSNFENYQSTTTDAQGNYELEVPNGTYTVEAEKTGYAATKETGVSATEGQTTTVDVSLQPAATVSGTVTDANGNALGGAEVVIHDDGYQTYEVAYTDQQGKYSIQVPGGSYTARADKDGHARKTHQVDATSGSTTTRDFSLGQPAVIQGTVLNASGMPATSATVVVDGGDSYYVNRTNASGGYSVDVPAGDYSVTAYSNSAMGSGGHHEGLQAGSTYTVDVDMTSPTVHDATVTHVAGTAPNMGDVDVNTRVMGGMMLVQLVNASATGVQPGMPHDLSAAGVDDTTEFEITVTVEDYDPSTLLWGVRDVSWSTSPNGSIANATDVTIRTKAVDLQGIDTDPNGNPLPVGPVQNYEGVSWPTGSDDKADRGWNDTVYFGVFDMSNVPSDVAGNVENMTIATNAQAFSRPRVTDEGLTVYVAGPHLTTYGAEHSGFYDAFIPDAQLDSWGVEDPSSDLNALYKGDSSNFAVEETADGAWIRLDISYSDGTVEIEPTDGGGSSTSSSVSGDVSSTGGATETPAATTTPTTTIAPTTTSVVTTASPAPATTSTEDGTKTVRLDTRTTAPEPTTEAPGGQPGFGLVVALVAIVVVALRRRRA